MPDESTTELSENGLDQPSRETDQNNEHENLFSQVVDEEILRYKKAVDADNYESKEVEPPRFEDLSKWKQELAGKEDLGDNPTTFIKAAKHTGALENVWYEELSRQQAAVISSKGRTLSEVQDLSHQLRSGTNTLTTQEQQELDEYLKEWEELEDRQQHFYQSHQDEFQQLNELNNQIWDKIHRYEEEQAQVSISHIINKFKSVSEKAMSSDNFFAVRSAVMGKVDGTLSNSIDRGWMNETEAADFRTVLSTHESISEDDYNKYFKRVPYDAWRYANAISKSSLESSTNIIMEIGLGVELSRFASETNVSTDLVKKIVKKDYSESDSVISAQMSYSNSTSELARRIDDNMSLVDTEVLSDLLGSAPLRDETKEKIRTRATTDLLSLGAKPGEFHNSLGYEKAYAIAGEGNPDVPMALVLLSIDERMFRISSNASSGIYEIQKDGKWNTGVDALVDNHPELSPYKEWFVNFGDRHGKQSLPPQNVIDGMVTYIQKSPIRSSELSNRVCDIASTKVLLERFERSYLVEPEYAKSVRSLMEFSASTKPELKVYADNLVETMREVMLLKNENSTSKDWDEVTNNLVALSNFLINQNGNQTFSQEAQVLLSKEFLKGIKDWDIHEEQFQFVRDTVSKNLHFANSEALRSVFFGNDALYLLNEEKLKLLSDLQGHEGMDNGLAATLVEYTSGDFHSLPEGVVLDFAKRINQLDDATITAAVRNRFVYLNSIEGLDLLEELSRSFGGRVEVLSYLAQKLDSRGKQTQALNHIRTIASEAPDFAKTASESVLYRLVQNSDSVIHGPEDWKFLNDMSVRIPQELENILPYYAQAYEDGTITTENRTKLFELISTVKTEVPQLLESPGMYKLIFTDLGRFVEMQPEKVSIYLKVFQRVDDSPSQEVQRIKEQLLSTVFESENPEEVFNQVEQVFITSSLQCVNRYKVFDLLHSQKLLSDKISEPYASPLLKEIPSEEVRTFIFNELLKVQIYSGNRELRDFLKGFQMSEGETNTDIHQLRNIVSFLSSHPDFANGDTSSIRMNEKELVTVICRKLQCDQKTIYSAFAEKVLKPVGFDSYEEVLSAMEGKKKEAHMRGLSYATTESEHVFDLQNGDLIKAIDSTYFSLISQDGSVAKEFLGSSAGSDKTPLDTDLARIREVDIQNGKLTKNILKQSIAGQGNYGDIYIVSRSRGQFTENINGEEPNKSQKPHVFISGVLGEQHEGITVGFALTDADFLIATQSVVDSPHKLNKLCFEIAKGGYYIPVVDDQGKVVFTPEQYAEYSEAFSGLTYYDGDTYEVNITTEDQPHFSEVRRISSNLEQQRQQVRQTYSQIRQVISEALSAEGISLRTKEEALLLDPELSDTGSTGRGTNLPSEWTSSIDFDLSLMLATPDFKKHSEIIGELKRKLPAKEIEQYGDANYQQIRLHGAQLPEGTATDIDIGLTKKSRVRGFESHEAIASKLENIQQTSGEKVYQDVVANIILTKKIMKDAHAYKKQEDGGLGGIGVETWLLQHHGNMIEAFLQFRDSAYQNGERVDLGEFKKKYQIWDAGINVKNGAHDNYIEKLTVEGYNKMLDAIDDYLAKNEYHF